jgi:hypothetical protein
LSYVTAIVTMFRKPTVPPTKVDGHDAAVWSALGRLALLTAVSAAAIVGAALRA